MRRKTLSPDKAEALWQEAKELKSSGKKRKQKKAIKIIKRLIKEGPGDSGINSRLKCFIADVYTQDLQQHDKAIEYYQEALEENPKNSLAGSNLGFVYMRYKRDYEMAVKIFKQTLRRGVPEPFIRGSTEDWLADAKRRLAE
jgi:tetratricopeptide (TPR) repeat protein